jgi:hypothetical protein
MTRTVSAAGMDWGLLAAGRRADHHPGALVIWFVATTSRAAFALGRV